VQHAQAALGLLVFFALAFALSERRAAARLKVALAGVAIQLLLAAALLKVDPLRAGFALLGDAVQALQHASEAGSGFVFGYLGGAPLPFEERQPGASFVLAFRALPLILVLSALTAVLNYWRVLPWLVRVLAAGLHRTMGVGAAAGLGVAANVFLGMVEAPLFIRPWLARLTRSELFVLMTAGMATIAGTVMVLYASILGDAVPGAAGHLLTASVISAPAAVAIALIMIPESAQPTPAEVFEAPRARSTMEAVVQGKEAGLKLLLTITAMLVVLVALVHLLNAVLGLLPHVAGEALTLERMLGWLMRPVVWLMGVPWREAASAGALMGIKTVLNEFLAYLRLAALPAGTLSESSRVIMTYALCGFANPGSLGILVGGLVTLAPARREEIVALGFRSIVAGTLATCSTGAVVAIVGG
jgi:CNT family concentrative nucleoside transporter